jgi:predicted phage baseplate assembly protein
MDGMENVRLICYESDSRHLLLLNGSNGMPKQRFLLDCNDIVFPDKLRLMVREQSCSGEPHWYDWNYTNDYAKAGPVDRVFGYDNARHEIVFGDNVNGAVPKAGENNILIVSCVMTQGSHGNILANSLEKIQFVNIKLSPCNLFPSGGGYDGDNVQSAVETFRTDLKRCTKAVTASDYEEITYNTPGLRVLGVKAIPYYDPDTKFTGDGKAAATVTIVVMPYNESQFPKPDEKFLQVVRRNLEQYRLITTNVKVIAPSYIRVSIYAEVVLQNISDGRIISEIRTKIERLFDIQKRISMGIKPSFGESVRENTMISKIAEVSGVNHVKKVTLSVKSTEGYRDKYGNIQLPPYAIAYLGDFEIRPIDLI